MSFLRTPLPRRTFLRGMGLGASVGIGLPVLEAMLGRRAQADDAFPKRFLLFFWGNGNLPTRWVPELAGPNWAITPQLAPLEAHRAKLAVVTGLSVKTGNAIPHYSGASGILTGGPLAVESRDESNFIYPSIDQVIAQQIGQNSRFASLELGVVPSPGLSFRGPNQKNPPEFNPSQAFERLFGGGFVLPGEDRPVDPRVRLRRSVLDAVLVQSQGLRRSLGTADRLRLDQHLEGIRTLERRLARIELDPPQLQACQRPSLELSGFDAVDGRLPLTSITEAMSQLLAYALACDQTRVASLWFSHPVRNTLYPQVDGGHHRLTHDEPGDQPKVHSIVVFIMQRLAQLITALDSIQEGEATLLDHTLLLALSDVSFGRSHSLDDMPVLIAGGAGGIRVGQHHRLAGQENASQLLLTSARIMGLPLESFGYEGGRVTTGLEAIER